MKPPLNVWLILQAYGTAEPSVAEPVNFTRTKPGLFLMFASARCGSDWLADMLQKHPRVCMQYGETGQHSDEVGHNVDSHAL